MSSEPLKLKIQLFAAAREVAQCDTLHVEMPLGSTVADLRETIVKEAPALESLASSLLVAVNSAYADDSLVLANNSEIAVFPPVSGG